MFRKILIANRGEIAGRIIRTLKSMGIRSVTVYDVREENAPYVRGSDESYAIGQGVLVDTFLNSQLLIKIARQAGCEAIHPGYGFLSENAGFAKACADAKLIFIGPDHESIALMGNKLQALDIARDIGIPVIPGYSGSVDEIMQQVSDDSFPLLVKASAGGGGKGMQIANNKKELPELLRNTSREAKKYFADGQVYAEKYFPSPRHIEVQILADKQGNAIHLFERECTVQRRYQKIIEEAPSVTIDIALREKLTNDAIRLAKAVNYESAGTIEFLLDAKGNYYFLEMNTRIQVEHAVTEMITGVDLVAEQIRIAAGFPISVTQDDLKIKGHAIEARIYAEDPVHDFQPSPGKITLFNYPEFEYLRVYSDLESFREILSDFDPMIAKMVVRGNQRREAIDRLLKTLKHTTVHGVRNNLVLLQNILADAEFRDNNISTQYITSRFEELTEDKPESENQREVLLIAGICYTLTTVPSIMKNDRIPVAIKAIGRWRQNNTLQVILDGEECRLRVLHYTGTSLRLWLFGSETSINSYTVEANRIQFVWNGIDHCVWGSWKEDSATLYLSMGGTFHSFVRKDLLHPSEVTENLRQISETTTKSNVVAPMNGKIIRVNCNENTAISKGDILLVIESMKMENEIRVPFAAMVKRVSVHEGDLIKEGQLLVEFE